MSKPSGLYTTSLPPLQAMEPEPEFPTSKSNYQTDLSVKSKRTLYNSFFFSPPENDDIDPLFNYPHPLTLLFETLLMPKFTEPSNASNHTKLPDLTDTPTPSTSTAANFSSLTSDHTTMQPLTSSTIPKVGKPQPCPFSADPTNQTTPSWKHTAPSPSSKQLQKSCHPSSLKIWCTSLKLTTSSLQITLEEDQADPLVTHSC